MEPFDIIKMNIQELYNNAPDFESLKVKAQENAKQIVWTSGFYFQLEPYECERLGFKNRIKEYKNRNITWNLLILLK